MVNIGVRADSGSWNTMAIRSPRISLISSSVLPMSSSPFMMMEPVTLALSSSRPIRLNAVTDLPEPDSPTMPAPQVEVDASHRTAHAGLCGEGHVQVAHLHDRIALRRALGAVAFKQLVLEDVVAHDLLVLA